MSSPTILTRSEVGAILFLNSVVLETVGGTVLIVEKDGEQKPIYYTNKALHSGKLMY